MNQDTEVENVEFAMRHTALGLREAAWTGGAHVGVMRKSHLHPPTAQREASLGLSLEELSL